MNKLKKAVAACHTGPTLKPVSLLTTIRDTGYWLFLSPISFLVYIEREREGKHVLEIICGTRFSPSTVCAIAQTQVSRLGGKHLHPACHFVSTLLFSYCTCDTTFVSMKGGWAKKTVPGWRKSSSENPSHAEEWNCQCPAKPHHSWRVLQEPHITTTKSLGTFIPSFFFFLLCFHPLVTPFCSSFFASFRHFGWPSQKWSRSLVVTFMSHDGQRAAKVVPPGNWVHLLD